MKHIFVSSNKVSLISTLWLTKAVHVHSLLTVLLLPKTKCDIKSDMNQMPATCVGLLIDNKLLVNSISDHCRIGHCNE